MADTGWTEAIDFGPDPNAWLADFDATLATLAQDDLAIFAQYVLRDEAPGSTGMVDGEVWTADDDGTLAAEMSALDGSDGIDLQPYHFAYLDSLRTNQRVVCTAHTESGKTQLGIAYILWRLGRNPSLRVAVVSEGSRLATAICRSIAKYIGDETFEGCRALRRVFPNLRPGATWGETCYEVERPKQVKDFSFAPFGAVGGITGARCDIIFCDDLITPRTTASEYIRQQNVDIFDQKIQNRPTARGQIVVNCNAQWSNDLAAQLESRGYFAFRMSVTKDGTVDGELEWPSRWTRRRIQQAIRENPDWQAMLFAVRRQIGEYGRFDAESIRAACRAGKGRDLGAWISVPEGAQVCIGVDFAFGESKKSDQCAIAAVLVEPPAEGERMGRRVLVDLVTGKWNELDARHRLEAIISRFPRDKVRVRAESNAGQRWIVQSWGRTIGEIIHPYRTGAKKWDPVVGVPALASAFLANLWVLPSDPFGHPLPEVKKLIDQMAAFDPSKAGRDHTGDSLMALFFADGIARETMAFEYRGGHLGDSIDDVPEPGPIPQEEAVRIAVRASDPFEYREPVNLGSLLAGFR